SYNMLLGQSGMLSFGHAVYSGMGAYIAVHVLNLSSKGQLWMPVSLLPLVGGLAGAFFGVLFGYVTTKRAGTTFAMITLGIGELLAAFIGGVGFFFGPVIGACLFVYFVVALSDHTKAWLLYLGLFFMLMVMFAPGGIASLLMMQLPVIARKRFKELLPHYART